MSFDPFGDQASRGYLRNTAGENDLEHVKRLEHRAFAANILRALDALQAVPQLRYDHVLDTNRTLFGSVYPWAGQDRAALAPHLAIGKAGHFDLFAHPGDVRRAVGYGLDMAQSGTGFRHKPGEAFGALAYGHPFLDTNGRTLMTVHADMTRRAGFHIAWQDIPKTAFLQALTAELRQPGKALDDLLRDHIRPGPMPLRNTATQLATSPALNPPGSAAPTLRNTPRPGEAP